MLNAIGLQNIGAQAFLDEKLPHLREIKNIVVMANIFGYTREDYERTIEILNDGEGIAAYELNVSCPNTAHGGLQFGSDPRSLDEVVTTAKRVARRPLIVKLSPNVTSIAQMAYVAQEAGADALSLVNTFVAMAIDPETRKPRIANVTAGLSGPAIKPIAVRMVYDAAHAVKIPVIGMGGISTATDVIEFMLAGAFSVNVCESGNPIRKTPETFSFDCRGTNTKLLMFNSRTISLPASDVLRAIVSPSVT